MAMAARKHYPVPEIYRITHLAARTTAVGAPTRCDRQSAETAMLIGTQLAGFPTSGTTT